MSQIEYTESSASLVQIWDVRGPTFVKEDPDRPPAAAGGLRSQVPDLVHGPRELLDCRQLQQAGRRERARFFDRRSKAGIDLAASAITLGRQSLN